MDTIGEENRVPVLNVEEGDLYIILGFPIAALFLGGLTGIDAIVFPLVLVGVVLGIATVYAAPNHLPASVWLADVWRYYTRRPRWTFGSPTDTTAVHPRAAKRTDGGVAQYNPFAPEERTQDLTNVERAWPGAGAVERSDGALVAMLEIDPANMDFAMSGDWADLQEHGEEFVNDEQDFPLTFHATTRPFPSERLTEQIEDRLEDDDVSENPIFKELLQEYHETRPDDLEGTQQLRYYLGVEVHPFEVYNEDRDERSPAEKLTQIPVLGILFTPFVTRREQLTEAEVRAKMIDTLDTRCRTIETEFVSKANGWSSRRLDTVELFVLAMEFWSGDHLEYGDETAAIRTMSAVSHDPEVSHRE